MHCQLRHSSLEVQLVNFIRYIYKKYVFTVAPVNCGDPGVPENGWRLVHGTTESSTVEYSCVEGYALNGTSERTCMSSGEWSEMLPICQSKYPFTSTPSLPLYTKEQTLVL